MSVSLPISPSLVQALCALIFASVASGCGGGHPHGPARRVILVTCDTLRADRLGTYGYAWPTSPNVDAFARENVVFEKAYATAPWTVPSLCALLTGKLPDEIGVPGGPRYPLPPSCVTLAEMARDGGYMTAAVVSNWVLRRSNPQYDDPTLGEAGTQQGFDHYDDEMTIKEAHRDLYERFAPDTTAAAARWLEERKDRGEDRFFLWVHFQDPHGPYQPPADVLKRFERPLTDEPKLPIGETDKGKGQIPVYQVLDGETRPEFYRLRYDAEIAYFDESFGHLIAELRRLDWYEDTLIVFSADHGESLGDHGYWFCHGENLYVEEVHVPLVIHFPRGVKHVAGKPSERGERVTELVGHLDLWPTMLEALGIPAPDCRGASLFRETLPPDRVGVQTFSPTPSPERWEAVEDGRYRLVMAHGAAPQLFDHADDPGEIHDLAPSEPDRVASLMERMRDYVDSHRSAPLQPIDSQPDEWTKKALKTLGYTESAEHGSHVSAPAPDPAPRGH